MPAPTGTAWESSMGGRGFARAHRCQQVHALPAGHAAQAGGQALRRLRHGGQPLREAKLRKARRAQLPRQAAAQQPVRQQVGVLHAVAAAAQGSMSHRQRLLQSSMQRSCTPFCCSRAVSPCT